MKGRRSAKGTRTPCFTGKLRLVFQLATGDTPFDLLWLTLNKHIYVRWQSIGENFRRW